MHKSVFIVKDHKTYMNAEEAWYKFHNKREGSYLIIIIPVGDPNKVTGTLKDSIDDHKWEDVRWIKTFSNYNTRSFKLKKQTYWLFGQVMKYLEYLFNFIDAKRLNFIAKKYHNIEKVFSGHRNTQEHLAAKLNPSELTLMDSGTTFKKVTKSGFIDYTLSYRYRGSRFGRLMNKFIRFKIFDREKTKLFTIYTDSIDTKHQLIKCDHAYKKKLIQEKEIGEKVVYISSPVYQITQGVAIDAYVDFLKSIIDHFKIDNENFIYIPNPIREKKENIEYIVDKLSCECDDRLIPVEMKISMYEKLPKYCISLYSTALVNLYPMVDGKINLYSVWHPDFEYFEHITGWKKEIINNNDINIEFIFKKNPPKLFDFDPRLKNEDRKFLNYNDWRKKESELLDN